MEKSSGLKYLILIACTLLLSNSLWAQSPQTPLVLNSMAEAWEYAFKHNPDEAIYRLRIEKARTDIKVNQGNRLPQISGSFSAQHNFNLATTPLPGELVGLPGQTIDAQFGQAYNYNLGVNLSQDLYNPLNSAQVKIAKNSLLQNEMQKEVFEQSLKQEVARAYYNCLINQASLETALKDQKNTDSLFLISKQKMEEGLIDGLALRQAEINQALNQQNIYQRQVNLVQSIQQLKLLLDVEPTTPLEFREEIKKPDTASPFPSLGLDKNLSLRQLQIQGADEQIKLQQTLLYPKLSLQTYLGQQQFREDFGLSLNGSNWNPYNYLTVNLQVPIFSGFSNRQRIKSARNEYQIAQQELKKEQRQGNLEDELLLENYRQYLKLSQSAQKSYDLYAEKQELARQKLDEGLIDLENYLRSYDDYLRAEETYWSSLALFYGNYAQIISR